MKPFIRSKTWITPAIGGKYAGEGGTNFNYTESQKQEFRDNPELWLAYVRCLRSVWDALITAQRKGIEHEVSARYRYAMKDGPVRASSHLAGDADVVRRSSRR